MISRRILGIFFFLDFAINVCLSQQLSARNSQLPVSSTRVWRENGSSRDIMGGAISTIGNTPEFLGRNRYISFQHRRHRVDYSEQTQRSHLQHPMLSERHDNDRSVGGTALKQRKKKTFKQIVQENLVEQIIHHFIAWDICTVPVEKAATSVLPSSIFLSTAVGRFCARRVFKLLTPVLQPVVNKLNQGIEKRVGPEAEERKRNIIFKRYGSST